MFTSHEGRDFCCRKRHRWLRYYIIYITFAHIRRQFRSLCQDADGTMQCFVWHMDQNAFCHCLAAIPNLADDSNKDPSS